MNTSIFHEFNENKEIVLQNLLHAKSWESRLRIIVQLGKSLPEFPVEKKNKDGLIENCENEVFLTGVYQPQTDSLYFFADTNVRILKGLIAFLFLFCQGGSPEAIYNLDFELKLKEYQVIRHLSRTRNDGLKKVVNTLQETASQYMK